MKVITMTPTPLPRSKKVRIAKISEGTFDHYRTSGVDAAIKRLYEMQRDLDTANEQIRLDKYKLANTARSIQDVADDLALYRRPYDSNVKVIRYCLIFGLLCGVTLLGVTNYGSGWTQYVTGIAGGLMVVGFCIGLFCLTDLNYAARGLVFKHARRDDED